MSEQAKGAARTPPRFVPTLTEAVMTEAAQASAEPQSPRKDDPVIAAAFAEILKDWPELGTRSPDAPNKQNQQKLAELQKVVDSVELANVTITSKLATATAPVANARDVNVIALRAEALVMQRLPGVLSGLVAQAVHEALAEQDRSSQINRE